MVVVGVVSSGFDTSSEEALLTEWRQHVFVAVGALKRPLLVTNGAKISEETFEASKASAKILANYRQASPLACRSFNPGSAVDLLCRRERPLLSMVVKRLSRSASRKKAGRGLQLQIHRTTPNEESPVVVVDRLGVKLKPVESSELRLRDAAATLGGSRLLAASTRHGYVKCDPGRCRWRGAG